MAKAIEQIVETYVRYNSPTECLRNERPRHQFNDLSHPPGHDDAWQDPSTASVSRTGFVTLLGKAELGYSQIQDRPVLDSKIQFNGLGGLRNHIRNRAGLPHRHF